MTSLYQQQNLPAQYRECRTGMTTRDVVEIGTSLLGGLGIGAALMYLFDPETGPERRTYLADSAADTLGGTRGYFGQTIGSLGSAASNLAERFGEHADDASEGASSMWNSARKGMNRGMKSARQMSHRASDDWRDYLPSMPALRSPVGSEHDSVTNLLVTAATCVVAGAALMYIFDPQSGRRRRALARDKAASAARQTGDYASRKARHYRNMAQGRATQAANMAHEAVDSAREGVQSMTDKAREYVGSSPNNGSQPDAANPT